MLRPREEAANRRPVITLIEYDRAHSKMGGFTHLGTDNGWHRYGVADGKSGAYVDLREMPDGESRRVGNGHHSSSRLSRRRMRRIN